LIGNLKVVVRDKKTMNGARIMKVRKVSIIEDTEGWTVDQGMVYQSALEALLAIKTEDRGSAKAGQDVATVIEWTATSRVGRAVLSMITDSNG
jgi:hypothetical protein